VCDELVDEWVSVSEQEIADAVYETAKHHHKIVEGAAGVAIAGMARLAPRLAGKQLGVVICGNNIGAEVLAGIISERSAADSGPRL
jgi:threonine dehydratase